MVLAALSLFQLLVWWLTGGELASLGSQWLGAGVKVELQSLGDGSSVFVPAPGVVVTGGELASHGRV